MPATAVEVGVVVMELERAIDEASLIMFRAECIKELERMLNKVEGARSFLDRHEEEIEAAEAKDMHGLVELMERESLPEHAEAVDMVREILLRHSSH